MISLLLALISLDLYSLLVCTAQTEIVMGGEGREAQSTKSLTLKIGGGEPNKKTIQHDPSENHSNYLNGSLKH